MTRVVYEGNRDESVRLEGDDGGRLTASVARSGVERL